MNNKIMAALISLFTVAAPQFSNANAAPVCCPLSGEDVRVLTREAATFQDTTERTETQTDPQGRPVSVVCQRQSAQDGLWHNVSKTDYHYNAAGLVFCSESFLWDEAAEAWVPRWHHELAYDARGNEVGNTTFEYDADTQNWVPYMRNEAEFDARGQQTSTSVWMWDAALGDWQPAYSDAQRETPQESASTHGTTERDKIEQHKAAQSQQNKANSLRDKQGCMGSMTTTESAVLTDDLGLTDEADNHAPGLQSSQNPTCINTRPTSGTAQLRPVSGGVDVMGDFATVSIYRHDGTMAYRGKEHKVSLRPGIYVASIDGQKGVRLCIK